VFFLNLTSKANDVISPLIKVNSKPTKARYCCYCYYSPTTTNTTITITTVGVCSTAYFLEITQARLGSLSVSQKQTFKTTVK